MSADAPRFLRGIATLYHGTWFRSTLEADWAATLDALGISWQYEPEGLTLPSGGRYRPDFYLPDIRTWLEVKGPHDERLDKTIELATLVDHEASCDPSHRNEENLGGSACCRGGWWNPWQIVVIGRPADPADTIAWADPLNEGIELGRCCHCRQWYFFRECRDFSCRRCGYHDGDSTAAGIYSGPGDLQPDFVRVSRHR